MVNLALFTIIGVPEKHHFLEIEGEGVRNPERNWKVFHIFDSLHFFQIDDADRSLMTQRHSQGLLLIIHEVGDNIDVIVSTPFLPRVHLPKVHFEIRTSCYDETGLFKDADGKVTFFCPLLTVRIYFFSFGIGCTGGSCRWRRIGSFRNWGCRLIE